MKRILLLIAIHLAATFAVWAQDVIVTKTAQKIEAKVVEISDTEVRYKKQSNLDGPTYVEKLANVATIVYANGEVEVFADNVIVEEATETISQTPPAYSFKGWSGDYLPKFSYQKTEVPGKKYKKYRYVSADGSLVLTSSEFVDFIQMYCPEAYKYEKRHNVFVILECVSILIGLVPVIIFYACAVSARSKILPTYNNSCAMQSSALELQEEDSGEGVVALSLVTP